MYHLLILQSASCPELKLCFTLDIADRTPNESHEKPGKDDRGLSLAQQSLISDGKT